MSKALKAPYYGWAPHDPPFTLALQLAQQTQGAACEVRSDGARAGSAIDIGARSGTETSEILNASMYAIAIECQPDEYVRLHAMWRLNENVSLFHVCASNSGPSAGTIYNADGASTMIHANAVSHGGERIRYLHSERKTAPVIKLALDQLLWESPLPAEVGGRHLLPSEAYVSKLRPVTNKGTFQPHPVCAIKADIQGGERAALEGLRLTLMKYKPVVYFEYDHRFHATNRAHGVMSFLKLFGYVCVPNDNVTVTLPKGKGETVSKTETWPCQLGFCDITCSTKFASEAALIRWMLPRWNHARGISKVEHTATAWGGHNPWLERPMTQEEERQAALHRGATGEAQATKANAKPIATFSKIRESLATEAWV